MRQRSSAARLLIRNEISCAILEFQAKWLDRLPLNRGPRRRNGVVLHNHVPIQKFRAFALWLLLRLLEFLRARQELARVKRFALRKAICLVRTLRHNHQVVRAILAATSRCVQQGGDVGFRLRLPLRIADCNRRLRTG